jgi:hypothetical protein
MQASCPPLTLVEPVLLKEVAVPISEHVWLHSTRPDEVSRKVGGVFQNPRRRAVWEKCREYLVWRVT